jgi:cyclase
MLTKRIIPALLVRGHQLVKGKRFVNGRSVGAAEQAARIYARRGVDELIILDIAATPAGRGPDFEMVERMTEGNFCPVSVGGGVRSVHDVRALLAAGADKVVIGTAALDLDLVSNCISRFGSQAITVALDYAGDAWYTHCGATEWRAPGVERHQVIDRAIDIAQAGAGEIILTCINRDGVMDGYDLDMIRAVSNAVDIPLVAAGGCGTYQHMYEAIQAGADAVAAGAMFLFTDATPAGAAAYLTERGIPCRTTT